MRLVALVPLIAVLAACSSGNHPQPAKSTASTTTSPSATTPAATFDLIGTVRLDGPISGGVDTDTVGASCEGTSNPLVPLEDYEDLVDGAQVTVRDGAGAIVGVGTISHPVIEVADPPDSRVCLFALSVTGIQAGKGFYHMIIGAEGTKVYSEADFRALTEIAIDSISYSP